MIPGDRELVAALRECHDARDHAEFERTLYASVTRLLRIADEGLRAQEKLARINAVIFGEDRRE